MKKKYTCLIIVFLIVVSFVAFGRIAGNDFINFDDNIFITQNTNIQSGFNFQNIKWAFSTTHKSYWHPLTWLSITLDWNIFGANASGHHIVSLLLHIGAVIFLFLFLNKTTNNILSSAFAAALFAIHPLRVESVAWAAERKDVLSMFFGMACLYAYAFYAESSKISKYLLCLLLFSFAMMSKPMMVTLPFVLLLLDYWPLKRFQKILAGQGNVFNQTGKLVWEKIPFFILTIAVSILTFWAQTKEDVVASKAIWPLFRRASNAIVSYISYLEKTFWPFNLAVFYPYESYFPLWKILISGIVLISIILSVLYYIRKLPFLFVGWFWYLGTLIPVIGLLQVGEQAMADRYTYLPSIGIAIMLAWGLPLLFRSENMRKKILFPTAIAVLASLVVLTWQQCGYWKNSIKLFNHALHVTKDNVLAHGNLGLALFAEGKKDESIGHFNKAISISPNYFPSYYNRGFVYNALGQYQNAIRDYNEVIRLKPDYPEGYYSRGTSYIKLGQYQPAVDDFNKAISLNPAYFECYNNRAFVYLNFGQYQQALKDYSKAILLRPDYADAYNNRAFVYLNLGNIESGCNDARKACAMGVCTTLEVVKVKGYCR
jgi:tetratricopeptide (TPR) repeat protein